jgi:hypothetical protein
MVPAGAETYLAAGQPDHVLLDGVGLDGEKQLVLGAHHLPVGADELPQGRGRLGRRVVGDGQRAQQRLPRHADRVGGGQHGGDLGVGGRQRRVGRGGRRVGGLVGRGVLAVGHGPSGAGCLLSASLKRRA